MTSQSQIVRAILVSLLKKLGLTLDLDVPSLVNGNALECNGMHSQKCSNRQKRCRTFSDWSNFKYWLALLDIS